MACKKSIGAIDMMESEIRSAFCAGASFRGRGDGMRRAAERAMDIAHRAVAIAIMHILKDDTAISACRKRRGRELFAVLGVNGAIGYSPYEPWQRFRPRRRRIDGGC